MSEVKLSRAQKFKLEGRCASCGKFAYPYYLCQKCRALQNIRRITRHFEKMGWVDVAKDPKDKRLKMFKWNNTAPPGDFRKYSPEAVAKMSLPRLRGKPLTDDVIQNAIVEVLMTKGVPLTEKEIQHGFKVLKTVGSIIPDTDEIIAEYKLIQQKKSNLSRSQREGVEYKISFLLKRGAITESQLC